jgi:hypothetical protein
MTDHPATSACAGGSLRFRTIGRIAAAALILLLLPAAGAWAGGSSPVLLLVTSDGFTAANGTRVVSLTGTFNFDDLLQFSFPAGVIVSQGSRFVRYDVGGAVAGGTSALVSDGVDGSEVPALVAVDTPASAPAALIRLEVARMDVVLPADFGPGPTRVALYAMLDGEALASNNLVVTLP